MRVKLAELPAESVDMALYSPPNPKRHIPAAHLLPKRMPIGHRHGATPPPLR